MLTHTDGTPCAGHRCAWKDDAGHHTTETLVDRLERELIEATDRARAATSDSARLAVRLLAAAARDRHPDAKRVWLIESDQGDWLSVQSIDGEEDVDYEDGFGHVASWLDDSYRAAAPALHPAEEEDPLVQELMRDWDISSFELHYIDIKEALDG